MNQLINKYIQNLKCFFLYMEYEHIGTYFDPLNPKSFNYPYQSEIRQVVDSLFFSNKKKAGWVIVYDGIEHEFKKLVSEERNQISNEQAKEIAAYYASIYDSTFYRNYFEKDEVDEMMQSQYNRSQMLIYPGYEYEKDYGQFRSVHDEDINQQFIQNDFDLIWADSSIKGYEWQGNTLRLYIVPCYLYGKEGMYGQTQLNEQTIQNDYYWILIELNDVLDASQINFLSEFINQDIRDPLTIKYDDKYLTVFMGERYYFPIRSKDIQIYLDNEPYMTRIYDIQTHEDKLTIHKEAPNSKNIHGIK